MTDFIAPLLSEIRAIPRLWPLGRVASVAEGRAHVSGLNGAVAVGERLRIEGGVPLAGEVMHTSRDDTLVLLEGAASAVPVGAAVLPLGVPAIRPHPAWIGRVIDPDGAPLDGRPLPSGNRLVPLRAPAPDPARRRRLGPRLSTGTAVFDTCLPIVRGQRLGLFAGSGVGKTSLLGRFARGITADVVVIGLVGERGRELREFTEEILGSAGMARSVVVVGTSDQPALLRRRVAWTAMAVAEFFRDEGQQVLLLIDSITRFAEAHRELALAADEAPSMRGFPPSTAAQIMSLAERAGPGGGGTGDITAIFTVLVAGSDMDEPVADILRGTLDGHVVMDRRIAERGRFPAVDLLRSVSRSLPQAASDEENALIADARHVLGAYDRAEMMVQAGLYAKGTDPEVDRALRLWPALDRFLAQPSPGSVEESFGLLRGALGGIGGRSDG